ncbi:unnamed protein product [Effrenium voratum]|uniref:Uncharacterized protein n=1 Tax=Effrenium voratum TaxID=2562239 RepID=A0AA36IJB9_9DINO|nr:unnamed protein product [Effrenium voratum]
MKSLAKSVLDLGAPYLGCQMFVKVAGLACIYVLSDKLAQSLALLAALFTLLDIVIRIAASRDCKFALSKHGADLLLFLLFFLDGLLCFDAVARPSCRALRLVLPFAILVSVGGNMMRLTRKPKPPGDLEEGEMTVVGGAAVE